MQNTFLTLTPMHITSLFAILQKKYVNQDIYQMSLATQAVSKNFRQILYQSNAENSIVNSS